MKYLSFLLLLLPLAASAQQKITLVSELRQLSNLSLLPVYRTGSIPGEETTYDRRGGNDDGFGGTYSFVRRNPDSSLVMLDIDGPGVLNRIATPTPNKDTLDFYIDNAVRPVLSISYHGLFTGKVKPFGKPLCDSAVGGYFCYFPILFQKHLKIVSRGHALQFHQLQYRLFSKGTRVSSFHLPLSPAEQQALGQVELAWAKTALKKHPVPVNAVVGPGETRVLYKTAHGGRLEGLEFDTAGTQNLRLRLTWDDEAKPAVDCPLRTFFGYAFGKPALQALLCGTGAVHYTYFPMPFDHRAKITLVNEGLTPVRIRMRLSFAPVKRAVQTEGKFYAAWEHQQLGKNDPFHVFLHIKGKGHYVGTLLSGQGNYQGLTGFFEGDDTTATDGKSRMHGTGSEDYFNGGWYDVKGRWDHPGGRALSGCLGYGRTPAHTGGYRFFVADKISFEQSFYHAIEHGGSPRDAIPADYTSVSFYYCDRGKAQQQIKPE